MYFGIFRLRKTRLDKRLKHPISEDPSTSDMVNGPNYSSNMKDSTVTIFTTTTFSITVKPFESEKVSLSDMQNYRTVC